MNPPVHQTFIKQQSMLLVLLAIGLGLLTFLPASASAQGAERVEFSIPSGLLANALQTFALDAGVNLNYTSEQVAGKRASALSGSYSIVEGLQRLLVGSGLQAVADNGGYRIERAVVQQSIDPVQLQTVTVTARRTEESLQDVPSSVAVVTNEAIESSNLKVGEDIYQTLPNVNFTDSSSPLFRELSIRGTSNLVGSASSAPVVGVFVDGVLQDPLGWGTALNPNLRDMERVEVAYGPQTTAFGRGTSAGAINLVPNRPTDDFETIITLEANHYPSADGSVVVNTPIIPDGKLSARVLAFAAVTDGFVDLPNIADEDHVGNDEQGVRLSLRSQPTDQLTLDLSLSFDQSHYDGPNIASPESFIQEDPASPVNVISDLEIERQLLTGAIQYETRLGVLKSKTGLTTIDSGGSGDRDLSQLNFLTDSYATNEESFSQELRFESTPQQISRGGAEMTFNIGANYSEADVNSNAVTDGQQGIYDALFGGLPDDGSTIDNFSQQESESYSLFGDVRFYPTPKLEIAVGGRYSWDDVVVTNGVSTDGVAAILVPPQARETRSGSFSGFAPMISVKYDWTADLTSYVNFSTGYRPGGFFTGIGVNDRFEKEVTRAYEIGIKSSWLDQRLRLNASVFLNDIEDAQVFGVEIIDLLEVIRADNAPGARSIGGEILLEARPTSAWRLNLGIGYADAEFTDFPNSQFGDLKGVMLPNAPEWSFSAAVEYEQPVWSDFYGFMRGEANYTDAYRGQLDPTEPMIGDYHLFNLRAGLRGDDLEVVAYVENLFDEVYATGVQPSTFSQLTGFRNWDIGETRKFGVIVKKYF